MEADRKEAGNNPVRDIALEKKRKREEIKIRAGQMSAEEIRSSSERITEAVITSEAFRRADSVFCYISVGSEPDTYLILETALKEGRKVYVPRCKKPPFMEAVRIYDLEHLVPGRLGIPEPEQGAETCGEIDLAIVPCISVSASGKRLGHGGGYYDCFLEKYRPYTVCLCHSLLMDENIPAAELDIPGDAVASTDGFIRCPGEGTVPEA